MVSAHAAAAERRCRRERRCAEVSRGKARVCASVLDRARACWSSLCGAEAVQVTKQAKRLYSRGCVEVPRPSNAGNHAR
eukprot:3878631-Pleurochrysis_carterae.AAC.1